MKKKTLMLIVISYCANYYNDCQFTYKWHGTQLLITNCVNKCTGKTTHSYMLGTNYIATGVTSYHTTNQRHSGQSLESLSPNSLRPNNRYVGNAHIFALHSLTP